MSNPLVYIAEAGLLAIFLLHIYKTVTMVIANRAARPSRYAEQTWARRKNERSRKSLASSTMIVTGVILALFVVTHLMTFKFGAYYETPDGIRDLYRLQLAIFTSPGYVVFYVVAMTLLSFHLWHGVSSAAQSLGIDSPKWTPRIVFIGRGLTVLLGIGFVMLPVYTYLLGMGR
jgi:succinate dehydrogenase / fumarate reductase cytochrome b subunit